MNKLVYYEIYSYIEDAIKREKVLLKVSLKKFTKTRLR